MLLDHHRAKIVQPLALVQLLGQRPRANSVVMCHGVFDVVHPGHLRHLLYAKSKADVLVASVTADAHVSHRKGAYRPHVPQDMRAANLAMLDIVDYVVISDAPDPSDLIALLQPDFYAKGFEYTTSVRGQPIAEIAAIEAYGGEVLFTPGDFVRSSSALIEGATPDLRWEKLEYLMTAERLRFDDLRSILQNMSAQTVHVVGDVIVDSLLHCEVIGAQAKTPTISVRRDRREDFVGGAGIVAKHVMAAGASVVLTTVVGDDSPGQFVLDDLRSAGVSVEAIVDRSRPTTVKEAVIAGGYRLLKIDTVDSRSISDVIARQIGDEIREHGVGATVFSDFRHGIFNARTLPILIEALAASGSRLRVADSQVASRWGNVADFVGFDLLTPNEREARFTLGDQDSGVRALASRLRAVAQCRWLLLKLGARGVLGFGNSEAEEETSFALDSFADQVADPVGAGDAFLAYSTLAMLVRPSLGAAAVLGSFAAACACAYDGNVPVAPERVMALIDAAEKELGR